MAMQNSPYCGNAKLKSENKSKKHILQKRGQFDTFKIKDPKINEY